MSQRKKDAACLNVYIGKGIMSQLEEYCRDTGRTKTIVTEWALEKYLAEHMSEMGRGADGTAEQQ